MVNPGASGETLEASASCGSGSQAGNWDSYKSLVNNPTYTSALTLMVYSFMLSRREIMQSKFSLFKTHKPYKLY